MSSRQELNSHTRHLLRLKAFQFEEVEVPEGSTFACQVNNRVLDWKERIKDRRVIKCSKSYNSLLSQSTWKTLPDITEDPNGPNSFAYYPSDHGFLEIKDENGKLLGFRFPLKRENLEVLKDCDEMVDGLPTTIRKHKRGTFNLRHWGVWADYSQNFMMSKEMKRDLEVARVWFSQNQDLFAEASDVLRMMDAEQYVHMRNGFRKFMEREAAPDGLQLEPVAGVWHTVALNRKQVGNASETHQDWKDDGQTYNCVIPYGEWSGGDLILWPLKLRVQISEGEGFFFLGRLIAHSVTEVVGMRNSVDAFIHKSNFDCLSRKMKEEEEEKEVVEEGLVGGVSGVERKEKALSAMKRKGKDEARKVGEKKVRGEKNKKDKKRKRVGDSERFQRKKKAKKAKK
jgi:hypothetical protein